MHSNPKKGASKSGEAKLPAGKTDLKEQIGGIQNLLDSYPGSMFSVDQNYLYTAYNSAHFKLVHEIYGKEIQLGHSPLEYISNRDYPAMAKQKLDQVLSSGEAFIDRDFPIKIAGPDVFFNINYIPIKDENGTVMGVSVFAEDVTLLKKSKDARKETDELYINLFKEISSIILIIDVETKAIVDANQAACAFYGYSHSELTALKISDLAVLPLEELHSRVQKVANGEANHLQHAHRLANGEIREVDIYAGSTIFNGRRVNVAIVHDISTSKAAEERLREIFENVQDAPYRRNLRTDKYDYISPAIEQISGFTAEETISMPTEAVLAHMHTDDLANIEQTILDSIANPGKPYQVEYRYKHKRTNQYRWLQDHFTTVLDAQGHPTLRYGSVRDVTERKLVADKLQESEERYRLLVDNSYDAILLTSSDGSVLNANPAATSMFGMTEEEIIQTGRSKLIDVNDPSFAPAIHERERNGKYAGVLTFIRKDGSTFPAEITSTLFQDRDGNPRASLIIHDITERRRAEDAKQEAESRYRGLFEQSHDAIFILDFQGRHLTANQRAADMMGYSNEELHELSVRETSAELQQSLQVIQQLLRGEHVPHYERLFQKKDGTIFPVEINVELVRDLHGTPLHIQSVIRDISERKLAEENLRESEERWQFALEGAGDGVWDWNAKTNKVFFSSRWKSMLGYADDEIGDSLDEWQNRVHPDDLSGALDKVNRHLEGRSPYYISEHRVLSKDGSYKWILDRGKVVEWTADKKPLRVIGTHRDITEQKIAEEKLRDSEERFRLLFERSQAVMMIMEPATGKILDANPAAENFYGYSLEELCNMLINQINTLPAETLASERKLALEEKRNFFVFPHRLKSGEMRTVEVHSSPIQIRGKPVLFSIIHDVTKRKLAEEKLIESEERFSTAFHSSQEAISITRVSDNVYIDVNDAFCSVFELSRGQVIGRTSKELNLWVNPEERDELFKDIHEKGQVPNFETQFRSKTGRIGFMQASMGRTTIAGEECVLIFGRNITASKLAEEKLRESEENYRTFVEQGFDGIIFVDNQGIIVEWNRAIEGLTGLKKENVLGKAYWDVRFQLAPAELRTSETLQRFKENTFEMLQPGQSKFLNHIVEGEMVSTSGERRIIEQIAFRVITKSGYGVRSVTRDVTARKKAEAELRAIHEELEQRVRERTFELQTALSSLQRVAHVKDEFLASIGHELRTPLNVILGSAQLLQESIYGELNEKQSKAVASIENGGDKLLKLINNILDLTKLQSGEISVGTSPSSLESICRSVLSLTASSAKNKQLQVNLSLTPKEIMLRTDEDRIQQILLILVDNAIKFTPSGGRIGIDAIGDQKNKRIKIAVWDTGIGIAPENLSRLFQPFVQLDARLAREYEGSGLGLALAQQLAELFGGSIAVESAVDKGSRFTVTLPWTEED